MAEISEKEALIFIRECGVKLNLSPLTYASAAVYYASTSDINKNFDHQVIIISNLNLACKIHEENNNIKDIINVVNHTFHSHYPQTYNEFLTPDIYYDFSEASHLCEYVILTKMKFRVRLHHPHLYLLTFLKLFLDWIPFKEPLTTKSHQQFPAKDKLYYTALSLLYDTYLTTTFIKKLYGHSEPFLTVHNLALSIIYLSFQILLKKDIGIFTQNNEDKFIESTVDIEWWSWFNKKITETNLQDISIMIMDNYK